MVRIKLSIPTYAERRAPDAKQDFELVSRLVKPVKTEVARFEQERIGDFNKSLEQRLPMDGMVRQEESIQARKEFQICC